VKVCVKKGKVCGDCYEVFVSMLSTNYYLFLNETPGRLGELFLLRMDYFNRTKHVSWSH